MLSRCLLSCLSANECRWHEDIYSPQCAKMRLLNATLIYWYSVHWESATDFMQDLCTLECLFEPSLLFQKIRIHVSSHNHTINKTTFPFAGGAQSPNRHVIHVSKNKCPNQSLWVLRALKTQPTPKNCCPNCDDAFPFKQGWTFPRIVAPSHWVSQKLIVNLKFSFRQEENRLRDETESLHSSYEVWHQSTNFSLPSC